VGVRLSKLIMASESALVSAEWENRVWILVDTGIEIVGKIRR